MQRILRNKLNPITILGVWAVSMLLLTPLFMFISNIGTAGGEQKAATTLARMIETTFYGLTILSICTAIIFRKWLKKNWWFFFVIVLTIIPTAKDIWDKYSKDSYSFSETNTVVDGNDIRIKTEYYEDFKTIRSISIWKNGKRDSVWETVSKDGQILQKQIFNNDTLPGE